MVADTSLRRVKAMGQVFHRRFNRSSGKARRHYPAELIREKEPIGSINPAEWQIGEPIGCSGESALEGPHVEVASGMTCQGLPGCK